MKPNTIVIYPGLGLGHLIPAVELAKLFLPHNNLTITIPIITSSSSSLESFISSTSTSHPQISFHHLPQHDHQPPSTPSSSSPISLIFHHIHLSNPPLLAFLADLSLTSNILAVVLDMFCASTLDVATKLNLRPYFFFSSAASSLSFLLAVPSLQSVHPNFHLLGDTPLHVPGLPSLPASHVPQSMRVRDDEDNILLVTNFARFPEADGIIINSFEELEPRAVDVVVAHEKMSSTCPVYCIGPLIANRGNSEHECMKWLDEQPQGSVVLLSFGSLGTFSEEQLKEIGAGLEKSGQRFLWVVRSPDGQAKSADVDLDALLPEGFVERTRGRGLVVKSWAPQAEVLRHESVGGFVTHCGWNSILEAVSCGVAMIAWPLYAEQRMNKVVLVEEMKLGVEMEGYDNELVSSEEVEKKLRWLMESEGGRELKVRAKAMKEMAVKTREEGGSSERRWREFLSLLMINA